MENEGIKTVKKEAGFANRWGNSLFASSGQIILLSPSSYQRFEAFFEID